MISYTLYLGELNQGEFMFRQAGIVVVTAWKDKDLSMLCPRIAIPPALSM